MSKWAQNFDYVEVPNDPAPPFENREQQLRQRSANRVMLSILAKFKAIPKGAKGRSRWQKLRAENQRRHDLAGEMGHWPMGRTS